MFKNNRNGVELTMNVIIIAVISLLVLALLAFLLVKGFTNWNTGTSCDTHQGTCQDTKSACPEDKPVLSAYSCGANKKCCVNIGGLGDESTVTKPAGS